MEIYLLITINVDPLASLYQSIFAENWRLGMLRNSFALHFVPNFPLGKIFLFIL